MSRVNTAIVSPMFSFFLDQVSEDEDEEEEEEEKMEEEEEEDEDSDNSEADAGSDLQSEEGKIIE